MFAYGHFNSRDADPNKNVQEVMVMPIKRQVDEQYKNK